MIESVGSERDAASNGTVGVVGSWLISCVSEVGSMPVSVNKESSTAGGLSAMVSV